MNVFDIARVVIYRVHEKGLEVFLVNYGDGDDKWRIPFGKVARKPAQENEKIISLEPVFDKEGSKITGFAIEGEYHDIPSLRALLKTDIDIVKEKLLTILPDLEKGTFVAVKETFKKVLPEEYKMIKELKDIVLEKNSARSI